MFKMCNTTECKWERCDSSLEIHFNGDTDVFAQLVQSEGRVSSSQIRETTNKLRANVNLREGLEVSLLHELVLSLLIIGQSGIVSDLLVGDRLLLEKIFRLHAEWTVGLAVNDNAIGHVDACFGDELGR